LPSFDHGFAPPLSSKILDAAAQPVDVRHCDATNLLARLCLYEGDVLRFTFNPDAPFTNNVAEQAIRICKVKQNLVFRQECKTTLVARSGKVNPFHPFGLSLSKASGVAKTAVRPFDELTTHRERYLV